MYPTVGATLMILLLVSLSFAADEDRAPHQPSMSNARLDQLIKRVDPEAGGRLGFWSLSFEGYKAQVITDERADRMRIIVAVAKTELLKKDELYRLMQANFDSALDSRYAIAQGVLWSAYIHPLSPLSDEQFVSGLGQAINLAATFGTTYSSGVFTFCGGDSVEEQKKYYQGILKKGLEI